MFYKFLKFIFLSALTFVWGGCETKDEAVAGYGCFPTRCYNTTALNDAGKAFDIIECEDGEKYLRHPGLYYYDSELQKELPKGVWTLAPPANNDGCGATNCTYSEQDLCVDGFIFDEHGNEKPIGDCAPVIECPEK